MARTTINKVRNYVRILLSKYVGSKNNAEMLWRCRTGPLRVNTFVVNRFVIWFHITSLDYR